MEATPRPGLTLTRKPGQSIVIGEGASAVYVRVNSVDGGYVSLNVSAPRDVRIYREEVQARVESEGAKRPLG